MSYVVINAITVPQDNRDELERRFGARAGAVSGAPGFESFQLLRPDNEAAGDRYFVYTKWASKQDFENWMASDAFGKGHAQSGGDKRPAATGSEVLSYEVIQQEGS